MRVTVVSFYNITQVQFATFNLLTALNSTDQWNNTCIGVIHSCNLSVAIT